MPGIGDKGTQQTTTGTQSTAQGTTGTQGTQSTTQAQPKPVLSYTGGSSLTADELRQRFYNNKDAYLRSIGADEEDYARIMESVEQKLASMGETPVNVNLAGKYQWTRPVDDPTTPEDESKKYDAYKSDGKFHRKFLGLGPVKKDDNYYNNFTYAMFDAAARGDVPGGGATGAGATGAGGSNAGAAAAAYEQRLRDQYEASLPTKSRYDRFGNVLQDAYGTAKADDWHAIYKDELKRNQNLCST